MKQQDSDQQEVFFRAVFGSMIGAFLGGGGAVAYLVYKNLEENVEFSRNIAGLAIFIGVFGGAILGAALGALSTCVKNPCATQDNYEVRDNHYKVIQTNQ